MMITGWGFPWPVLLIPAVVMLAKFRRGAVDCGVPLRIPSEGPSAGATPEDPLVTLRERYAHGEIGDDEFAQRLDGLLRSELNQTVTSRET